MERAVIGYLHGETVRAEFARSLLVMSLETGVPVAAVMAVHSGPNLSTGRNALCRMFLEEDIAPWLFMCDTDMVLAPDTLDRLIGAADPAERPVLGALCWRLDPHGNRHPTLFRFSRGPNGGIRPSHCGWYQRDAVMRVDGTGAACLLIHRSALETVRDKTGDLAAPWFRETDSDTPGQLIGEDLTFCLRCADAGVPVHVHTGIEAGHVKSRII